MNLQEFAALRVGDKITSMNGSTGEVVDTVASGLYICWPPSRTSFFYSVQSTAWFHWSRVLPDSVNPAGVLSEDGT